MIFNRRVLKFPSRKHRLINFALCLTRLYFCFRSCLVNSNVCTQLFRASVSIACNVGGCRDERWEDGLGDHKHPSSKTGSFSSLKIHFGTITDMQDKYCGECYDIYLIQSQYKGNHKRGGGERPPPLYIGFQYGKYRSSRSEHM